MGGYAPDYPVCIATVPCNRLNLAGISAGAVITGFLGKSADNGNMRHDLALLSIIVAVAIILQLGMLKPVTIDKTENKETKF